MKCRHMRIANIGPVIEGEVDLKKVVVFVGPCRVQKVVTLGCQA